MANRFPINCAEKINSDNEKRFENSFGENVLLSSFVMTSRLLSHSEFFATLQIDVGYVGL